MGAPLLPPPPARDLTGLAARGVEEIVDAAFVFYRRRFLACLVALAVVQVPVTIGLTLISETAQRKVELAGIDPELLNEGLSLAVFVMLPSAVLSLIATQVGTGAVTYLVGRACTGRTVGVVESYRWALRRIMPLVGTAFLIGIGCVLGFFLFVVPAVIAFLVTFAAVPVVMLEERGVMDALRRSYVLATGSLGRVAMVRIIIALFFAVCLGIGYSLAGEITDRPQTRMLLAQIPTILAGPVDAVSMVLLYFDLRVRREGMDLEEMTRALEAA